VLEDALSIDAGGNYACAVDPDGIKCWGHDSSGQSTVPPGF